MSIGPRIAIGDSVKITRIGALISAGEHALASKEIMRAIEDASGNRAAAAAKLGVSVVMFRRWCDKLELWRKIDLLCKRKGFFVQPGPERGPRKKSE